MDNVMDQLDNILMPPPQKLHKSAGIAFKAYKFNLKGNSMIQSRYESIIASQRRFHNFNIEELDMTTLSTDDIEKLLKILEKFGFGVRNLTMDFHSISSEDARTVLSYFPNIESLSIQRMCEIIEIKPKVTLEQKDDSLTFAALRSITFDSKTLNFNKIFDNIGLFGNLRKLSVNMPDISNCFDMLKNNPGIEELSISSPTFVASLPIDHLKLKEMTIEMPKAKSLISLVEQQTELNYFDLGKYVDFEDNEGSKENVELAASINSETNSDGSDSDPDPEMNIDLLIAATKMKNLTTFTICIDEIPGKDFVHFSKLTQLKQLKVKSRNHDKIRAFSFVSLLNVTWLLLNFKRMRVPNADLTRIAINFPKISELIYEGDYFCDAFICFTGNLHELEKLTIMRNHDFDDDCHHFIASDGDKIKVNPGLKAFSLHLTFPSEQNVHNFMIRVALTAPNVESLWLDVDSMKLIPANLIYILRNFKQLKNINMNYDLFPDEKVEWMATSPAELDVSHCKSLELKIIDILIKYGARLELVQLCISSLHDVQQEEWRQSFSEQFKSIKTDDLTITMKKDVNVHEWKVFA